MLIQIHLVSKQILKNSKIQPNTNTHVFDPKPAIKYIGIMDERARGGSKGGQRGQLTPLQNHIKEVKRMMYKYKNTLKCTISCHFSNL